MNLIKAIIQITFLIIISMVMSEITRFLHLPIPGFILGIILVFILLKTRLLPLSWVETGANWLLAELLLFFVPSAVGVVQYKQLLIHNGLQMVALIIVSTGLVMACAGLAVSLIAKRKGGKQAL